MVTHPSTNLARRRLTSLIETNVLLLCQTTITGHPLQTLQWEPKTLLFWINILTACLYTS